MTCYEIKYKDWETRIRNASSSSTSALEAASLLGIKYATYKKYAIKYGCFATNQCGKGILKPRQKILLDDILSGKYPQYQSNKLRIRLIKENILAAECSNCQLSLWLGLPIPLELDHINGDTYDHVRTNLRLLCPNCHALTDTYRGKNKGINY